MSDSKLTELNGQENNLSSQIFKKSEEASSFQGGNSMTAQKKLALALKEQGNLAEAVDYYSQNVEPPTLA
jgi:hypothetical protein